MDTGEKQEQIIGYFRKRKSHVTLI